MPRWVIHDAVTACTFGASPSRLAVLPHRRATHLRRPVATILDHQPLVNILPFGACTSPANPQVAAATAAAAGVLTPQPCLPATMTPWTPGSPGRAVMQEVALQDRCTCQCLWGGTVNIVDAGQATQHVP
ncbi:DUF4280 domain-containing protein [Plastoroseomonas arctica]|uniref:DUF4280 domain-containing protein n=1 Tax=Plastoroseomonas arctica TaxID=1509237 RepID=A0AAF1KNG4_9PROT|nr:DUF4280 domain-containing protein [Plastoroseomonas arctica]MBR0654538.1 DUF4280 domain-containing protein [Plastoroseomonas arctica]